MDAPTKTGQDARSTGDSTAPAAADSPLPLDAPTGAELAAEDGPETDGRKKSREVLRGMMKANQGNDADDEPAADPDDAADPDAGETDTPAAAAAKPAEQAAKPADSGDAGLSEARDALIRDGWTSADLDKLSPERVKELGGKRQSQQKQQDGFGRQKHEEIADLKKRLAELEGTPASAAAATQATTQSPADGKNLLADPAFAAVAKELEALGESASPEVQKTVTASLAALVTAMESRSQAQLARVQAATEQTMLRHGRARLTEQFPALKGDPEFTKVTTKMQALARTGDYGPGDFDTLMEDACRLVLPAPTVKDIQRKMLEKSQKAIDGQMDAGQQTKDKTAAPVTGDERSRRILKLMKAGKSATEARRIAMAGR